MIYANFRSGKLVAIEHAGRSGDGHINGLCKCDCGCDVHHKIEKLKSGLHTLDNAQVLCPNCHREHHEIS